MKYYVVTDVHGFYTQLREVLEAQGFYSDPEQHKLIICGDLMDRGPEAEAMERFVLEMLEKDQLILIRGNHEDLILDLMEDLPRKNYLEPHHVHNGTVDTVCQLTGIPEKELVARGPEAARLLGQREYIRRIIPASLDYFETDRYIFVHGWIPCDKFFVSPNMVEYDPVPNWRRATRDRWVQARWTNGMEAAYCGILEPGKTIVCGHVYCAFGHACFGDNGNLEEADSSPFRAEGIIALDACTAYTGNINCVVIED